MMKPTLAAVVALLIACGSDGPTSPGNPGPGPSPNIVEANGIVLELLGVQDNWLDPDPNFPDEPDPGFRFLTVQVEVRNRSGGDYINAPSIDFEVSNTTNERFAPKFSGREPVLPSSTLAPGVDVRGWVTFEVPEGQTINRLFWMPTFTDVRSIPLN